MTLARGRKLALAAATIGNAVVVALALLVIFVPEWFVDVPWIMLAVFPVILLSNLLHYALLAIYIYLATKIDLTQQARVFWIVLMVLVGVFGQIPFLFARVWRLPEHPVASDDPPLAPELTRDSAPQV